MAQKRTMAKDIVEFDNAVQMLAMDEEPFAGRKTKNEYESQNGGNKTSKARAGTVDEKKTSPYRIHEPTLTASIKHKYIVRSRHEKLCRENRFMPVNKTQAKEEVKKETIHDLGEAPYDESRLRSSIMLESVHGKGSIFRNTSPVTQDQ